MSRYIVEAKDGQNARILAEQCDGTYKPIAQLFGDEGLAEGKILVQYANMTAYQEEVRL